MTNRRSFFGALAGLFGGFAISPFRTTQTKALSFVHYDGPWTYRTIFGAAGCSPQTSGRVTHRYYQDFVSAGGDKWGVTRVQVVGGEWIECPELGDNTREDFEVIEISRTNMGWQTRGRPGVCYTIWERPREDAEEMRRIDKSLAEDNERRYSSEGVA